MDAIKTSNSSRTRANANRAAWFETVAFLRRKPGRSSGVDCRIRDRGECAMPLKWSQVLRAGAVATASMDVLTVLAIRLGVIAPSSPNVIARWFASVARAHLFHDDIARAGRRSHELTIAIAVHYAIGMFLAALFVLMASARGWPAGSLSAALLFGVCTSVFPWLLTYPAMGYGFFGAHGPEGTFLFLSSLASHAFFGPGIWRTMSLT
jgi:DUF2938 family protein